MTWPPPDTRKVQVPYDHDRRDLQHVYLAVTNERRPSSEDWQPAYRDVDHSRCRQGRHDSCQRVVFVRVPDTVRGRAWIRDKNGARATRVRVG